jgi:CRP-like cAMP-binding protein
MENVQFLKALSLFSELSENVIQQLASKMLELSFEKGRRICQENEGGDALFVIKSGIVQIYVGDGPEKKVLNYLKRGDYFGEMALFTGDPRSASAAAIADVTVLGLTKENFEAEVLRSPTIALELLKTLSRRLANANPNRSGGKGKQGQIIFLSGSEKGAGKTSVARDLASTLAKVSGSRVILLDPNVQNADLAHALGIDETCDLAKELVGSDSLTVERYVKETPWGFWTILPQRIEQTTYPLKESHHHILMNALAEKFDYLVVDSSSTMALFNKHLMQSAAQLLVVLSGAQESLSSFLEPFQNLVLDQGKIDRRKVLYVLNQNHGEVENPKKKLGAYAKDLSYTLPHDPKTLESANSARTPASDLRPESPWTAGLRELGRRVYRDHSLEILLPENRPDGTPLTSEETVQKEIEQLALKLEDLFGELPGRRSVTLEAFQEDPGGPALEVGLRTTNEALTTGMDDFLQTLSSMRDRLKLEQILIRIDGRPSLF